MEIFKVILGSFLVIGLLFFIFIRAVKPNPGYKGYIKKGIWILIFGAFLCIFFLFGIIYDKANKANITGSDKIKYYSLPLMTVCFTLSASLVYFFKGRRKNKTKPARSKEIMPKTGIYLLFKYEGKILLKKESDKYRGLFLKLCFRKNAKDCYLIDEEVVSCDKKDDAFSLLKNILFKNLIEYDELSYIGAATHKKIKYKCYMINLSSVPALLKSWEMFDLNDLLEIDINESDKEIIYTSIVKDDFDIVV